MRRLNVKLVIILAATSLVTIVMVAGVHAWQMKRTARVLLVQAKAAQDEGDLEAAASFYDQYVEYVPDDAEEGAHMALLMADIAAEMKDAPRAKKWRAYNALEAQLRRHPERDDVRKRLIDYTILVGRWGDAIEHIDSLRKTTPDDVDLLTKLGRCHYALDHNREAEEKLEQAIKQDPHQVDAFALLAIILRERLNNPDKADQMIDSMVEQNPENAKAYLSRSQYSARYFQPSPGVDVSKRVAQRHEDLQKALALNPDDADTLLMSAIGAIEEGKLEEARRHLEHGADLHPDDARIVQQLINIDVHEKRFDDITARLEKGPKTAGLQQLDFDMKLQQRDLAGARKVLVNLEKDPETPPAMVDYMRACLDFNEFKWLQASKEFERVRLALPAQAARIDLMLGRCYEQLREHDREVQVYERAIGENPNSLPAHAGLAQALVRVGQHDRALAELQAIKKAQGVEEFVQSGPARGVLLTLLLQRNGRLPEADRDWKDIDELVAATAKAFPDSTELLLVESAVLEQKGDRETSRKMLQTATERNPKDVTAWLSLARLDFLDEGPDAAMKQLKAAQEKSGESAALQQAFLVYGMQLPPAEAKEVLKQSAEDLKKLPEDEQDRIRRLVGVGYFRLDDLNEARAMWTKVAEKTPNDPDVQFTLFDIAVRSEDDAAVAKSIDSIKKLFGPGSPEAKYVEARRLVTQVRANRSGDATATLNEARQLIRRAIEQRPRWAVLARFEGEIDVLDGHPDEAITHLQRAMDLGDADVTTARQVAQLLISRGRGDEARQYLQVANSRGSMGDVAASEMLEIGIALSENDVPKAVKLLEHARERDPDDPQKIVTLGQLLPQLARDEEAETLLRGLVDKHPELPLAWLELVRFLKQHQQADEAKKIVETAKEKVPAAELNLTMGQCYELLGDTAEAEKYFLKARDEKPKDLGLARALATFYARSKNGEQAAKLDKIAQSKPTNDSDKEHISWANRELAMLIASGGSYQDFRQAMQRLKPQNDKTPVSLADKVAMARLLANRPEADSRMEATRLLEEIKNETNLPADAQLILARLYEATGNWPKCRDEMLSLLGRVKDNPTYIGSFVEMLLRNNDLDAATFWMAKLEAAAPDVTLTTALKARVLVKQGKADEAVAALRGLVPRPMPREKMGTLVEIAKLMEQLEQNDAAESMYREYVALDPTATLLLAGFMGRHGSLKDSLDTAQSALETRTVEEVVREALTALRLHQADATKEDYGRVEGWATKAIARRPKDMILQLEYAELLDLQGRYPELEETYQRLLKNTTVTGIQRTLVLNNLAYLLAVQNKVGDSRQLIDEAIQILGPQSDLLDTRALVHLAHGEVKQAVEDLNLAVVDQPSGTKYFHLARANQLNKDAQAAQQALKKAIDNYGLKLTELPPLEQAVFRQLSEQLQTN